MTNATEVYVLRHAEAEGGEFSNKERPLSRKGEKQARKLVSHLIPLKCSAIYTSPFRRAINTVEPFSQTSGVEIQTVDDLREGAAGESLDLVRERMVASVQSIVETNTGGTVLLCTHGGTLFALISAFDSTFVYEDYLKIRNPDLKRFVYSGKSGALDEGFHFDLEA